MKERVGVGHLDCTVFELTTQKQLVFCTLAKHQDYRCRNHLYLLWQW